MNPSPVDAVPGEPGPSEGPAPAPVPARRVTFLNAPFRRRTYAEWLYGLVGLPIAVLGFSLSVTFIAFGVGTFITFLGIFVLAFAVVLGRWLGALDRGLINGLLGGRIQAPRRFKAGRRGLFGWALSRLGDPVGWRGIAYQMVRFPLAVATFVVTVVFWALTLGGTTYWIWYRFLPAEPGHDGRMHRAASLWDTSTSSYFLDTWPRVLVTALIGVLLLWLTPWIVHGSTSVDRLLGRALLSPTSASQRVRELEQTRSDAVASSNEQLRRIERDLHDGTQARLVALAMNLGQAKEDLGSDDPAAAERVRTLIEGAHQQTKETLTELRDLARGIHPPILDNGLESALISLGARSPIRVNLGIDLPGRSSTTTETITYFAIAEVLTNAVKHSGASAISVRVRKHGEQIIFSVADNGRGGAVLGGGTGLDGVQRRLATVDGTLDVDSPLGGPTTITGVLPFDA
ncbi:sensor histidine kinase [Actinospica sp.]|uniref:sensor histidine kinase n=1 Tax=Actinospica sp. TaxID=1872142 RepID=UPI002BB5C15A|nr:sensor domain-containing protein [Actinospica sp.]HWG27192.1 sensor domain-containing protein [Actinospica sp.]